MRVCDGVSDIHLQAVEVCDASMSVARIQFVVWYNEFGMVQYMVSRSSTPSRKACSLYVDSLSITAELSYIESACAVFLV